MKKYVSLLLIIIILITSLIPFNAFAADGTEDDAYFTQEEFEALEHTYSENVNVYV